MQRCRLYLSNRVESEGSEGGFSRFEWLCLYCMVYHKTSNVQSAWQTNMLLVSTAAYGLPSRIKRVGGRGDTILYFMALLWRKLCHGVVAMVVRNFSAPAKNLRGLLCFIFSAG